MSRTISAAAKLGGSRYSLNNTTALKIASSSVPGRNLHPSVIELPFRKTLILHEKLRAGSRPENSGPDPRAARPYDGTVLGPPLRGLLSMPPLLEVTRGGGIR